MSDWQALALSLGILAFGFVVIVWLSGLWGLGPEGRRKAIHVLLGTMTMGLPWLFESWVVVALLAAVAVAALAWTRWRLDVRSRFRGSLHGVARESYGEICFPVAIAALFALSHREPAYYLAAVLVLTLADAAGAIVGVRYGRHRLTTDEGHKSVEGSSAVFATAFVCVLVPLVLLAHWPAGTAITAALHIALLVTLVEGVSMLGFDNLLIPLLTLALVVTYAERSFGDLVLRILVLAALLCAAVWWRRRTLLNHAGQMGAAVAVYLVFAVCGVRWMAAPLAVALLYLALVQPALRRGDRRTHKFIGMFAVSGAGLVWALVDSRIAAGRGLLPFVVAFAVQGGLLCVAEWEGARSRWRVLTGATFAASAVALVGAAPWPDPLRMARIVTVATLLAAPAATTFLWAEFSKPLDHDRDQRWLLQAALGGLASLVAGVL